MRDDLASLDKSRRKVLAGVSREGMHGSVDTQMSHVCRALRGPHHREGKLVGQGRGCRRTKQGWDDAGLAMVHRAAVSFAVWVLQAMGHSTKAPPCISK